MYDIIGRQLNLEIASHERIIQWYLLICRVVKAFFLLWKTPVPSKLLTLHMNWHQHCITSAHHQIGRGALPLVLG